MNENSFNPNVWLLEKAEDGTPMHERICYLMYANGGLDVHGWGITSFNQFGHQIGLNQDEALELIHQAAFMEGLSCGGIDIFEMIKPYWLNYLKKLEDDYTEKNLQ